MPDPEATPAAAAPRPDALEGFPALFVAATPRADGARPLLLDGIVVGEYRAVPADESDLRPTLVVDLGWAAAADLRVVLRADPAVERPRGGIVLDR